MKRGDVVLVDFPFSDGVGSKNRPALVVQADAFNRLQRDTILVTITTRTTAGPTVVFLDPTENSKSGLSFACAVRVDNLHTIEQKLILGSIGYLSAKTMKQVDACLQSLFGL